MDKTSAQGLGGTSTGEAGHHAHLADCLQLQSTNTVHAPVPLMSMFLVVHSDWLPHCLAPPLLAIMHAFILPFNPLFLTLASSLIDISSMVYKVRTDKQLIVLKSP